MRTPNRKDLRNALKASLDTTLAGPSKVAQIVYEYQVGEFNDTLTDGTAADVSIYVITSDGTDAQQNNAKFIGGESSLYLNVHSFVLYEKENEWTEHQSEDKIDDMSAAFIEWCSDNADRRDEAILPPWLELAILDRSKVSGAFIGGKEYRQETFMLGFLVADGE